MIDQKITHEMSGKLQEMFTLGTAITFRRRKGFYLDQLQIQFVRPASLKFGLLQSARLLKLKLDTMGKFQRRVGLGGEKESKCQQIRTDLGGVRF